MAPCRRVFSTSALARHCHPKGGSVGTLFSGISQVCPRATSPLWGIEPHVQEAFSADRFGCKLLERRAQRESCETELCAPLFCPAYLRQRSVHATKGAFQDNHPSPVRWQSLATFPHHCVGVCDDGDRVLAALSLEPQQVGAEGVDTRTSGLQPHFSATWVAGSQISAKDVHFSIAQHEFTFNTVE